MTTALAFCLVAIVSFISGIGFVGGFSDLRVVWLKWENARLNALCQALQEQIEEDNDPADWWKSAPIGERLANRITHPHDQGGF